MEGARSDFFLLLAVLTAGFLFLNCVISKLAEIITFPLIRIWATDTIILHGRDISCHISSICHQIGGNLSLQRQNLEFKLQLTLSRLQEPSR